MNIIHVAMRLLSVNITTVFEWTRELCVQTEHKQLEVILFGIFLHPSNFIVKTNGICNYCSAPSVVTVMMVDNGVSEIFGHCWCVFWTIFHVHSSLKSYNHDTNIDRMSVFVSGSCDERERARQSYLWWHQAIQFQFYCLCTFIMWPNHC